MQRYTIGQWQDDISIILGVEEYKDLPFGETTVGVFDEERVTVIAYASEEVAERIVSALNADHGLQG